MRLSCGATVHFRLGSNTISPWNISVVPFESYMFRNEIRFIMCFSDEWFITHFDINFDTWVRDVGPFESYELAKVAYDLLGNE